MEFLATRSRVMHLGELHCRLIEWIDAHQARGEDRFQHAVHHQRAEAGLVQPVEVEDAHRTPGPTQRLGHGVRLRRHQVAHRLAGQIADARLWRRDRPAASGRRRPWAGAPP